jgi:hypothetical protein
MFLLFSIERTSRHISHADSLWRIRLDPLAIGFCVCNLVLVGKMVVMLPSLAHRTPTTVTSIHTSRRSGLRFL